MVGACRSACGTAAPRHGLPPAGRRILKAAALTHEAYAEYTLEFHRVRRSMGGFTFELYDAPGDREIVGRQVPLTLSPRLAPS